MIKAGPPTRVVLVFVVVAAAALVTCKRAEPARSQPKALPVPPRGPLALSVHVGVKRLSVAHYGKIDPLFPPPTDAREMQKIARAQGFTSPDEYLLLNEM